MIFISKTKKIEENFIKSTEKIKELDKKELESEIKDIVNSIHYDYNRSMGLSND